MLTRQFAQGSIAPSLAYGAAQTRGTSASGTTTASFPEASYDQVPNSQYPFTPTLGQEFNSRLSTLASESRGQSETYSNLAQQSTSSAVTRFHELRNALSKGSSLETSTGTSEGNSIQSAFSEVDQASLGLQRQFGLSRRAADDITTSFFLGGEGAGKAGLSSGPFSLGATGRAGGNRTWTDSDIGIASEDRSRILGNLQQLSDSRNWSSTREGFVRTVSQSSNSAISSTASGISSSLTEAQSYTLEARRSEELAHRLETQASWFAGNSASGSLNLSQAYRDWGLGELDANRDYYGSARFDDIAFQLSPHGEEMQARFVAAYADRLHDDIEGKLALPDFAPINRPGISGAGEVRGSAPSAAQGQPNGGELGSRVRDLGDEVRGKQGRGQRRIGKVHDELKDRTSDARGASAEAADEVKEW